MMVRSIEWFIVCAIINLSLIWNKAACVDTISEVREEIDALVQELKKSNDFVKEMRRHIGALNRQVMPTIKLYIMRVFYPSFHEIRMYW